MNCTFLSTMRGYVRHWNLPQNGRKGEGNRRESALNCSQFVTQSKGQFSNLIQDTRGCKTTLVKDDKAFFN